MSGPKYNRKKVKKELGFYLSEYFDETGGTPFEDFYEYYDDYDEYYDYEDDYSDYEDDYSDDEDDDDDYYCDDYYFEYDY